MQWKEENNMPGLAIAAVIVFGILFLAWVILPSIIRKKRSKKGE